MTAAADRVAKRRVAVVGGGIAGLSAACFLSPRHDVTLYEAEPRLGGHARTVRAGSSGLPVDTGFIIFNKPNYPHLWKLFERLDIPRTRSEMSFSVSLDAGGFEYALKPKGAMRGILAQPRNGFDPKYWGLFRDILRFNASAETAAAGASGQSLRDLLDALGTGDWFRDRFLLPLTGAIWSVPTERALDFPAQGLIRFLGNHGLLSHRNHPQWYTVAGGSEVYVSRLGALLQSQGVELRIGAPVTRITRRPGQVQICAAGEWRSFDQVVLALHADQVLPLLEAPSEAEHRALSAIRFQKNPAILHSDPAAMPRRRAAWASWNFLGRRAPLTGALSMTYWMNALQTGLPRSRPMFVSLNPDFPIDPDLIHDRVTFEHPIFDLPAERAKQALAHLNGDRATWYCGAWMLNGFHEDGIASAAQVAKSMIRVPSAE